MPVFIGAKLHQRTPFAVKENCRPSQSYRTLLASRGREVKSARRLHPAPAPPAPRRSLARVLTVTALGFSAYACWAAFANRAHGVGAAAKAGVVQGLSSAVATAMVATIIEIALARLGRSKSATVIAALCASSLAAAMHITLHLLAGTEALFATVSVPIAVGVVYSLTYASAVQRALAR